MITETQALTIIEQGSRLAKNGKILKAASLGLPLPERDAFECLFGADDDAGRIEQARDNVADAMRILASVVAY